MAKDKAKAKPKSKDKPEKPAKAVDTNEPKKKKDKPEPIKPKDFSIGKASNGKSPKSVKDLKGASYNPRFITDKELNTLDKSMDKFGDLSGIVFNVATGVLVSGHQRVKIIKTKESRIVKQKMKRDRQGTIALGIVEVKEEDGTVTSVPYREVDWTDKMTEMAANIAANMAGGQFDQVKLGAVMHKLEQGQFDVELTSIDNWDLQKAIGKYKKSADGVEEYSKATGKNFGESGEDGSEEFQDIDPSEMEFNACCPKCKFRFNVDVDKPQKQKQPVVTSMYWTKKDKPKSDKKNDKKSKQKPAKKKK